MYAVADPVVAQAVGGSSRPASARHTWEPMEPNRAPDVVRIDDATVTIASRPILGPVSLTVRSGESWAILGPNGSGKSTLLDLAGGIRHPTSGVVEIFGRRLGSVDVRDVRARIGFVGHHVTEAIPARLAVRDVVLTGKRSTLVPWMQAFDDDDRRLADELLRRVGCDDLATRPLETCSQGERQRVLLARALFGRPELLLLDEPAAGLDLPGRASLLDALSSTADPSPTAILVTQHVEEIPSTATHAALLRHGHLVASGSIAGVLTDENVTSCFDLAISVSANDGRWRAQAR
jgi:iron complex transport system ATP-binding protein